MMIRFRRAAQVAALILAVALRVAPVQAQAGANEGVLNPNLADGGELLDLGLEQATVDAILEDRPFLDMLTLDALLKGDLDEAQREELYRRFFVPLNLNTASDEEIQLIPGVASRMAHEFDEYRPYVALAQFRREIGKYVDEEEVARFEQYIFLPIDLNTASEEDILSIPGVGPRLLHEFQEYRPYTSIEQFRREIGKYVDDGELARLERFVLVK